MKTKTKLLASVLCLLMVVCCVVGLASCGEVFKCSHQWEEWSTTTEATCTEVGAKERKCSKCGETETSTLTALGHDWNDATCSTPKTCKTCSVTEGTAAPHIYSAQTVKDEALKSPATCTEAAVYYKSCSCGAISTNDADTFTSGDVVAHSFTLETVKDDALKSAATCTEAAVYYKSCTCGAVGTDDADTFTSGDVVHSFTLEAATDEALKSPATTASAAVYYKSCACGVISTNDADTFTHGEPISVPSTPSIPSTPSTPTPPTPHTHSFTLETVKEEALKSAATCTDAAVYYKSCSCGAVSTNEAEVFTSTADVGHKDDDHNHVCDRLCGKNDIGDHGDSNTDSDHVCDYGCGVVLEDCSDVDNDTDHACDVCGTDNVTTHFHTENTSLATAATCVAAATKTYECNCGDTYTEDDGDALGHNITGVTPTEELVEGCEYVLVYVCQRADCGADVEGETVYYHTHVASITTPATCSTPGEKSFVCSACGDTSKAPEEIPANATGHSWTAGEVTNGVRIDTCSVCSTTKTVTVYTGTTTDSVNASDLADKEIELNDANISLDSGVIDTIGDQDITLSADKLEGDDRAELGLSEDQLAQVGDSPIYNFTINNGSENISDFGEENYVTITLPYTLTEGEDIDSIAVWFINDDGELESIEATYNGGYVTFKTNHFSYYTVTRLTPVERCALYGHGYASQHVEGSCTKDAYDIYVCIRCHDKYIDEDSIVVADGHDYSSETQDATCTKNGYVRYTCNDCGHSYRTKTNATGHTWSVTDSADATCEADGYTTYSCSACGTSYTITLAKLPHVYTDTVVPATCEVDGYTLHDCDNCDYSYTDTYVEATGHAWSVIDSEDATCEADGYTTYGCDNCDQEYTETHEKTPHVYTDTVVPATCETEGYTLHDCDNCDYSYTDGNVPAIGHDYGDGIWTWESNGNKATLNLICANDETHTEEFHVTNNIDKVVEKGECSNYVIRTHTATVEWNGVTYTDVIVITQGNPSHTFATEWTTDENEHWHECVCGAKSDVSEHTFGDATTTKEPTCIEDGESTSTCSVCGETKVTSIPATDEHNYVDGVCTGCGIQDIICDHTNTHLESIDFGELGGCDWTLYYYTCDCGEVQYIDESSDILCDLEESFEEDEYVDENGNTVVTAHATCSCGFEITVSAVVTEEGCHYICAYTYDFDFNGEDVVDISYDGGYVDHKDIGYITIDLSEYDTCGGWIEVYGCKACGEIVSLSDYDIYCNVDLDTEPEVEEVVDDDGIVHYVQKAECPDCGFELVVDRWVYEFSVCEKEHHMNITIASGDTTIVDINNVGYDDNHNYEYSYEMNGETCDDGYIVTFSCDACGANGSYSDYGHNTERREVDLSEFGLCGGYIEEQYCVICDTVTYSYLYYDYCWWSQIESGDGYSVHECSRCGATRRVEFSESEKDENCQYKRTEARSYSINGEEICRSESYSYYVNHDYEYEFEMDGETCDDGYTVTCTCKDCGYTDTYDYYGHYTEHREVDLSELGLCGGYVNEEYCLACSTVISCYINDNSCSWSRTESGDGYAVYTCRNCGTVRRIESFDSDKDENCQYKRTEARSYSINGEEIYTCESYSYYVNHDYEYEFEMDGETCDDGYTVTRTCKDCGDTDTYGRYGHFTEHREVDLSELGLCGGYVGEDYCLACRTVINYNLNDRSCSWSRTESGDNYNVHECRNCGTVRRIEYVNSDKGENCQYTHTETRTYTIDGEEVYTYESSTTGTNHCYKREFIMAGDTCEDGYTTVTTCVDCDYRYDSTSTTTYHGTYGIFELYNSGVCCKEHYVYASASPCGQSFSVDADALEYDEQTETYFCNDCGLTVTYNVDSVEEGCSLIKTNTLVVKVGDEVIYSYEKEYTALTHSFVNTELSVIDDETYIVRTCDKCNEEITTEMLTVETEDHNGTYYYDYTFIPEETATYTIRGLSDRDTYVTLYEMKDGDLVELGRDDDSAGNAQFFLTTTLTEGTTYVYRIRFYNSSDSGSINFALTPWATDNSACQHTHTYNTRSEFSALLDGAESCEDGILYGSIYSTCGCIDYVSVEHQHRTIVKDKIDLAENGACRGEFIYYSCACGQESYSNRNNVCYDSHTSNEYYDEEGRLIHVDVRTCSTCGLRYTNSYYTVKDRENCTLTYYYTVVVNIGENLIIEKEYTDIEESHDYDITAALVGGEGTTCNDGVIITYTCKDCEYSYSNEANYHQTYVKEEIDLSELGSVCGGYATVYGCACGQENSLSLDHSLCEWGREWCTLWIEDAITEGQYTVGGWNSYWYDSYIYTCAVTDPEDAACAYKIRYANYCLKDEDSCMAYRYQTWQFGYDEETGTYEREITFRTGSGTIHHNYVVDNSTDDSTKYDCPDCGSYYYINRYYDEEGYISKEEYIATNTLDNGYNKYYEYVIEYDIVDNGSYYNSYISREYTKYIRHDDTEYSYEYGYLWHKNYPYTTYQHTIDGDSWCRYDYTYSFDGECIRTELYTNSEGERRESTNNVCKMHNYVTIKAPTCSQDGEQYRTCVICDRAADPYTVSPTDHNWVQITDNWYYCFNCGMENANGVSGDIIMEDLTETYGNDEYYVVGYYARNSVQFSQYVSLVLADGTEVVIPSGIDFITIEGIRSFAFSKAAVDAWAADNGYTDYDVRLSFVPVGSDSSFDYGITFADPTVEIDTIIDDVSFTDYIGAGETNSYTITPTEDGVWTFTSFAWSYDTYGELYDANGNRLAYNDDGGQNNNFKITYELKAGETYTVNVRWYDSNRAGNVALLFDHEPVVAE